MREVYKPALILKKYFNINSARITLTAQTVLSLIKVGTVCSSEAAAGFAGKAGTGSDEKRIHRFPKNFPSDTDTVARFVSSELPEDQQILTADRTYRESGKLKIGIPVSAVVYKGVAIPLLRKMPGEHDCGKKATPIPENVSD